LQQQKLAIALKLISKYFLLLLMICNFSNSIAQFTLRIEIAKMPSDHQGDGIFVAGNFNQWNPADSNTFFKKENNKWVAVVKNLKPDNYEFKCTRGDWQKTEIAANGKDIVNRSVQLHSDTTIQIDIEKWKDDFNASATHTASANVHIMDTAFFIPQLNRYRRIWLYLPEGYAHSKKHYPVMYLQDGQNLFDALTSGYGEWGVDECLDSIITATKKACIIVGIDHGGESRMSEYNPYEFVWKNDKESKAFTAEGDAYVQFLKETLKPFIDAHYRTMPSKENTTIAGASMGGVIAYYAALKYPEVFGKAGIFSPAFWTAPALAGFTDSLSGTISSKFFFYMGGNEGEDNVLLMDQMAERLASHTGAMIYAVTDAAGRHNETAWQKWFAEFYNFMMADGFNYITKPVE
jgi:metallo-beta-lactamase class B